LGSRGQHDPEQGDGGQKRSYWNIQSLKNSRASSWIIAVISQLGLIGVILLGILLVELFRRPAAPPRTASGCPAGAESLVEIAECCRKKLDLLRRFCPFTEGTQSHDQLGTLFAALDAEQFQSCFVA